MNAHTSKIIASQLPCPDCGSSDALAYYDDNHSFCFSCSRSKRYDTLEEGYDRIGTDLKKKVLDKSPRLSYYNSKRILKDNYMSPTEGETYMTTTEVIKETTHSVLKEEPKESSWTLQYVARRKLTADTHRVYKVQTRVLEDGKPYEVVYPYGEGDKIRRLPKQFYSIGRMVNAGLFGKSSFAPGQGVAITITEGEDDAMAAYQMLGSKYPSVSIRSAVTAEADCRKDWDYINSFQKIYLCLDSDAPGQEAAAKIASMFDFNKVFHVKLNLKDACEYLEQGKDNDFVKIWWNAKKFLPKGVKASFSEFEDILNQPSTEAIATFPFGRLNEMTYGIRTGETYLFKAPEKIGKTEVFRAIEYHVLKTTEHNIGIIHLEEKEKRTVQGLCGYELALPVHLPDAGVSNQDQVEALKRLVRVDGRLHIYSHFGTDDPEVILDIVRHMASASKCKVIFLDHISMIVSGSDESDERKKLDYIATKLATMARDYDFALMLISHVNDDGKTRGSRYIAKVADTIISLNRDIEAESYEDRNTTKITVQGNRFGSVTGPSSVLWFDSKTFKLSEKIVEHVEEYNPGF